MTRALAIAFTLGTLTGLALALATRRSEPAAPLAQHPAPPEDDDGIQVDAGLPVFTSRAAEHERPAAYDPGIILYCQRCHGARCARCEWSGLLR